MNIKKLKFLFNFNENTDTKILENILYYPNIGITNFKINMYNEFINDQAKIFFKILNKFKLEYAVFAGQSIGLVRDKNNIPWVDDYDIIIFRKSIKKLKTKILPILKKHDFNFRKPWRNRTKNGGCKVLSNVQNYNNTRSYFLCDIFYSYFNKKGELQNIQGWGRYHNAKLNQNIVLPFRRRLFHNKEFILPFFNKVNKEVKICYGNVYNKCKISTHSFKKFAIYKDWKIAYRTFNAIKERSISNTKQQIYKNDDYKPTNKLTITDNHFKDEIELLSYLSLHNMGKIYIFNKDFLKRYSLTIKFYFPNISIECFIYEKNRDIIPFLNYVDYLHVKNNMILDFFNDIDLIYLKKPIIKIIRVITFGTYDLFHFGHKNLFERCKKYGNKLIVGISSDELNIKKKNIKSFDSIDKRIASVKNSCYVDEIFVEESLELKNDYIKKYDASILIMGDDWKNKFDWVDCSTIYLKRTPNINSTKIRKDIM